MFLVVYIYLFRVEFVVSFLEVVILLFCKISEKEILWINDSY